MKYLLFSLLLLTTVGLSAEWNDPALPLADTDKPVYQWTGCPPPGNMWLGGKCYTVRIPTTADLKQQLAYEYELKLQAIRLAEIKRGSWLFMLGLMVAGVGAVAHFATSIPQLQRLSEWLIVGGFATSGLGLLIKKASEYQNFIILGLLLAGVAYVLYSKRKWSVSHLGRWFKKDSKDVT